MAPAARIRSDGSVEMGTNLMVAHLQRTEYRVLATARVNQGSTCPHDKIWALPTFHNAAL